MFAAHSLRFAFPGTSANALPAARSWLSTSRRRGARWLRQMASEFNRSIAPAPLRPDSAKWLDNSITMAWLGHSTVLISFYGLRILTDPVLGARVGIRVGPGVAGP